MQSTDLPEWQKLVTVLAECLRTGAEGHRVADFTVTGVTLDRGKITSMVGGSLRKRDAEAFAAKVPFQTTCNGMKEAARAFVEAAAARGQSIYLLRIVLERKSGNWEVARTTFQTAQERAVFLTERAPYEEPIKQALMKIPTGSWNEVFVRWQDVITDSEKFRGHWDAKGKPTSPIQEPTSELRDAYEAVRGFYERHGYKLERFAFTLTGGPKRAQIDEVDDFYG